MNRCIIRTRYIRNKYIPRVPKCVVCKYDVDCCGPSPTQTSANKAYNNKRCGQKRPFLNKVKPSKASIKQIREDKIGQEVVEVKGRESWLWLAGSSRPPRTNGERNKDKKKWAGQGPIKTSAQPKRWGPTKTSTI